jgi:hypothetical protein
MKSENFNKYDGFRSETWEWNKPNIVKTIQAMQPHHWDTVHKTALVLTAIIARKNDLSPTRETWGVRRLYSLEDLTNMMLEDFWDGDESKREQARQLTFLADQIIKRISLDWEETRKANYTPIGRRILCELVKKYPEKSFFGVDN